jgi:hypothetical protein
MRAEELLAQGDLAGAPIYQEMVRRINRLLEAPALALH